MKEHPPKCPCPWCQLHYYQNLALERAESDNLDLFGARERIAQAVKILKRPNCGCTGCDQDRTDALYALQGKGE